MSSSEEWPTMTRTGGFVHLAGWMVLRIEGFDRARLLHNLCTNDINALSPGAGCEAFITDVKGHTQGHVLVWCTDECLLLLGVPGQADALTNHLNKYIIREDAIVTDASSDHAVLLLAGENLGQTLPELSAGQQSATNDHRAVTFAESSCRVGRCDWYGEHALLMIADADHADAVRQGFQERGLSECSPDKAEVLRIESGMPRFGTDFDAANLPQEVNRDAQAISFTKGCYLGQETVARIDALGHVNKKLVSLQFDGPDVPATGDELFANDKPVGRITSAAFSLQDQAPLAIAMVRRGHNEPGTQLIWQQQVATIRS